MAQELNKDTIHIVEKQPTLVVFTPPHQPPLQPDLQLCSTISLPVLYTNAVKGSIGYRLKEYVGIPIYGASSTPSTPNSASSDGAYNNEIYLTILDLVNKQKYVQVIPEQDQFNSREIMKRFVQLYEQHQLQPFRKSAPRILPNDMHPKHENMMVVVANSFEEIVLNPNLDVILDAFTDWCPLSQLVNPIMVKLQDYSSTIKICKMNCDENDMVPEYLPIDHVLPILKLFPALPKNQDGSYDSNGDDLATLQRKKLQISMVYSEKRIFEDILNFILENIATKVDRKVVEQRIYQYDQKQLKNVIKIETIQQWNSIRQEFKSQQNAFLMVYYMATWCAPCRVMNTKFAEWSQQFSNSGHPIQFIQIDIEKCKEVVMQDSIKILPTFRMYSKRHNHANSNVDFTWEVVSAEPEKIQHKIAETLSSH